MLTVAHWLAVAVIIDHHPTVTADLKAAVDAELAEAIKLHESASEGGITSDGVGTL